MVAPINSIGNSLSSIAEIRRINITEPQQSTVETRRNALIESNQLRKNYVAGLENYIKLQEESIQLHKESRQLHKESRQLHKEFRDLTQKQIDVLKDRNSIIENTIKKLSDLTDNTNRKLLALFDKKPSPTPKVEKFAKPTHKVDSTSSHAKEDRIAARKEQSVKLISIPTVETKPVTTGKVFDYIPKVSVEADKQDTSITYKPTIDQLRSDVVRATNDNVRTIQAEESKVPSVNTAMRQMVYYSQKNLWESIIAASVSGKLV